MSRPPSLCLKVTVKVCAKWLSPPHLRLPLPAQACVGLWSYCPPLARRAGPQDRPAERVYSDGGGWGPVTLRGS